MIQSVFQNKLLRNAAIGFMSSALSDSFTNSIRVIKTTKQAAASKRSVSYSEAVAMIFAADGWKVSQELPIFYPFNYFHFN